MTESNSLIIYKNQLAVITEVSDKISIKYQATPKTPTGKSATYSTQKIREKDMTLLYPKLLSIISLHYVAATNSTHSFMSLEKA